MLIAVDLDEVLAETLSAFVAFHNQTYNTHFAPENFHSYKWWEVLGEKREHVVDKFLAFAQTHQFQEMPPLPEAVDAITFLAKKHELIVLTSRQSELEEKTKLWIEKHFPKKFKEIYITNHPDWAKGGKTMTKVAVCQRLHIEVLIEDSLDYAQECVSDRTTVFLLNHPWNQGKEQKGIVRVHSWKELLNHPFFTY
jgi:uncharacterized HAD superfamily protein